MTIKSITVTDGSTNSSSYLYGDNTGTFQSIQAITGDSAAYKVLNKQSSLQAAQTHWNGLSQGAKIGIACGVLGFVVAVILAYTVICVAQRKKGRAEKALADKEWNEHEAELMEYRTKMAKGDFAISYLSPGNGGKF